MGSYIILSIALVVLVIALIAKEKFNLKTRRIMLICSIAVVVTQVLRWIDF